jgi:hypothetical protein
MQGSQVSMQGTTFDRNKPEWNMSQHLRMKGETISIKFFGSIFWEIQHAYFMFMASCLASTLCENSFLCKTSAYFVT